MFQVDNSEQETTTLSDCAMDLWHPRRSIDACIASVRMRHTFAHRYLPNNGRSYRLCDFDIHLFTFGRLVRRCPLRITQYIVDHLVQTEAVHVVSAKHVDLIRIAVCHRPRLFDCC